ncbi:probable G-protein coupled receptor 132 [Perognathus longimembris pacificus]|uniref:probable G-protein coupled receptor 132 n=1 Tax=Perognathus longimembris pacificus TaxID=214514 RepID=UPI0020197C05|nr:probable G-protein coupled receptor 132 [Perognathus longimembris pacificus]
MSYETFLKATLRPEPANVTGNSTAASSPASPGPRDVSTEICNVSFEDTRMVLVVAYSTVCALGLPANGLTAWLAWLQVLRGNVLSVYLLGLALCELLYVSTLPLWAVYIHNRHRWTLGPRACQATAYIFFCNIYISILLLCCISCDRFTAVVYALESRGLRRQRTAASIAGSIFLLVGLVHYPVFDMEPGRESCFEPLQMSGRIAAYHYARFTVGFALPLAVLAFTNHRILRSIRVSEGLTAAQKARVRRLAVAVVAIFLVCFSPYHVVLLVRAAAFSSHGGDPAALCALEGGLYGVTVLFLCLCTVNSVADPILYVLATEHSRQEVSRVYRRWKEGAARTSAPGLPQSRASEAPSSPTTLTNNLCPLVPPAHRGPSQPPGTHRGPQGGWRGTVPQGTVAGTEAGAESPPGSVPAAMPLGHTGDRAFLKPPSPSLRPLGPRARLPRGAGDGSPRHPGARMLPGENPREAPPRTEVAATPSGLGWGGLSEGGDLEERERDAEERRQQEVPSWGGAVPGLTSGQARASEQEKPELCLRSSGEAQVPA